MGDRVNFVFSTTSIEGKTDEQALFGNIVLYSHWGGSEAAELLAHALNLAKPRWDDLPYCTRILVCQIIGLSEWNDETGYGLSVGTICDNEYPYLIVDMDRRKVRARDVEVSYDAFISMTPEERRAFHQGTENDEDNE